MIIKVILESKMAHFGTSFTNHTSKMSYRVPSKSVMNGMLGAALGLSFEECQNLTYSYSFHWKSTMSTQMIAKSNLVIDTKNDVREFIRTKDWERGNLKSTIDYIEHLYSKDGKLEGIWIIEVLDGKEELLKYSLENPYFPLYMGKSEHFIKVNNVEILDLEKKYNKVKFKDFFIGEVDSFLLLERIPEKMKTYRTPLSFENVYTLDKEIEGLSKYGYYEIDGYNYSLW